MSIAMHHVFCSEIMKPCTVCPGSSDPFYIVTYYIKWVTTSWIYCLLNFFKEYIPDKLPGSYLYFKIIMYYFMVISLLGPFQTFQVDFNLLHTLPSFSNLRSNLRLNFQQKIRIKKIILSNTLIRLNNRDCSLRVHPFLNYHLI